MGEEHCAKCGDKIKEEDVFRHEGKPYCAECTLEHVKSRHAFGYRPPT